MSTQDSPPEADSPAPSTDWQDDENLPPLVPPQIVPRPNFVAKKPRTPDDIPDTPVDPAVVATTAPAIVVETIPAAESPKVRREDPRRDRLLVPPDPTDALDGETLPPATPLADPPASPPPAPDELAPGAVPVPAASPPDAPTTVKQLDPVEKRWLAILAVVLVVACGILAILMRDGFPSDSRYVATLTPQLPIKGAKITIESIRTGWKQLGSRADVKSREGLRITPEVAFTLSPDSNGALRIFFRNERDQQAGDTINLEIRSGRVVGSDESPNVSCTKGLRTLLEYNDLGASGNTYWAIEIHEGSDPRGPITDYTLLAKLLVPWNLPPHSSNER